MVLISVAALTLHVMNGGTKDFAHRKLIGMTHGIGLLISFVAGFGLIARLQTGFTTWIYAKLFIWLVFGGLTALIYKKPGAARIIWFVIILLAAFATFLARYKPFS